MRRLSALTIILILGAGGGASTEGAIPDDAAASSSPAARKPAPAPPIKYLEAGARLFNSGQFDLAAKYLDAAGMYRDQLEADERTMLDAYLKELSKVKGAAATPAATVTASPSAPPVEASAAARPDDKQRARWLLHEAREQILLGEYDDAEKKIADAEAIDVKWGLFDDTPAKARAALNKARPKAAQVAKTGVVGDHKTAKSKLKEARTAIANREFERAEAIALEVKGWNLSYGMFEDNPEKVADAARALRKRDEIRDASPKERDSQGVYDILVQESRELLKAGQIDQAEEKARRAQRMNVVPPLTADRAESVLHDIAMSRSNATAPGVAADGSIKPDLALAAPKGTLDPQVQRSSNDGELDLNPPALELAPADSKADAADGDLAPAPAPAPAPALELDAANPTPTPEPATPANRGEQLLDQAKALYTSGNYSAAKQLATEAKEGDFGVEAKAEELGAQIGLAEQGGALSLYEAALAAVRSGEIGRARGLLTDAAAAGSSLDENLQAKIQELLKNLADEPADGPAGRAIVNDKLQRATDAEALAAQKLNAEVGAKIGEARRLQEVDPDKALGIYETTLKAVKAAELTEALKRPMVRRLEVAIELAKKDKVVFEEKMKDKNARAEIEMKRLRILEADSAKQARLKEWMDKAQDAYAAGNYVEAETFAKRAMEIDPNEVAATMLVFKAKSERRYKQDLETKAAKEDAAVRTLQEVDIAAIANPEVQINGIQYAKNFKDLTRDRLAMNKRLEPKKDPQDLAIEARLKETISVNFDKQPLSEAVDFIRNYTGVNVVLDPKALSDEGLTSSSPVSMNLANVQLKTALKLMLQPLGLTYKTYEGVLMITSPQASSQQTYAVPYYVGDLMAPTSNPNDTMPGMANVKNPQLDANGQPIMPVNGAPGAAGNINGAGSSTAERPKVDMGPLIQLITTTIAPGTWRVSDGDGQDLSAAYGLGGGFGGGLGGDIEENRPPGAIIPFYLNISLIIRHTAEVHEQVADLLRQLRRLQDLQVSIEVRFITVADSFFEQIGIDFDFAINSKSVGKHSTWAFPINNINGTTGGTTGGGIGGGGIGGGGIGGGGIGGGGIGGGGIGGGGIGGGGIGGGGIGGGGIGGGGIGGGGGGGQQTQPAYLINPIRDYSNYYPGGKSPLVVGTGGGGLYNFSQNLQIPFNNTQGSLIAPFNTVAGAGATLGLAFLSDLEVYFFMTAAQGDVRNNVLEAPKVTTFNGAAAFIYNGDTQWYVSALSPVIGPGSVAFMPQPQSLVSGVTLSVTPVVSADRRYVRMSLSPFFQTINGFTTIQVPGAVGGAGLGGGGAAINATLQLPNTTNTILTTTVTVPDGGTVLLGGVKRLQEERKEYGVPVLSKTPWIDRLFRNVGIGRNTSSLMLMVTPRIIILEEEEEKLGIPSVAF